MCMVCLMILRFVTLTVRLPDSRVLLHSRERGGWPMWSATHEALLSANEAPLDRANGMLENIFGINPQKYSDDYAEITQTTPINMSANRIVYPFIMKMKKRLSCKTGTKERYSAVDWYSLLNDIIIYAKRPGRPKYTPTTVILTNKLKSFKEL